jgi:hypothetical protein
MMDSRWLRVLGVAASLVRCIEGAAQALSVPPSDKWYGDDGTWSAVSIRVGTPQQWIDVMVSTVSSETWVVGDGGCGPGGEWSSAPSVVLYERQPLLATHVAGISLPPWMFISRALLEALIHRPLFISNDASNPF